MYTPVATVSYCYGQTTFPGVQVKLYKVAEFIAGFRYVLTPPFITSGLSLDGIESTAEWNVVRTTLEAHILAYGIAPDTVSATNQDGQVHFDTLGMGMYLAIVDQVAQDDLYYHFDSALVSVPGLGPNGRQYAVSVNAKGEVLPPVNPDEETVFQVLKLWKGDEGRTDRPKSVEVEIFRNGVLRETVVLSEENHWSYSWLAKDDGASWSVAERSVPQGYTVTVDVREASFVLTNTRIPTQPGTPVKPPQTGDTANVMLYVLLMTLSGTMLIVLGISRKRLSL